MTPAQERQVKWLEQNHLRRVGRDTGKYEYKRCEVEEIGKLVFVYQIVGLKGDENTAAEIYGRDIRHVMIGARGGMRLLNWRREKGKTQPRGRDVLWRLTAKH